MLIQNRYRHYRHVGSAEKRTAVAAEDDLGEDRFAEILAEVFNIRDLPGIREGRLNLERYRGKDTKAWR